ncbi:MAG: helix-turn-helix domain-containing protein [Halolamina sp.]
MGLCANVSIGPEEFRLASTLGGNHRLRIQFERVVPLDSQSIPFLWVTGVDDDEALGLLRADPDVVTAESVVTGREGLLAGIEWASSHPLIGVFSDSGATCLQGVGTADGWNFSLRFPSRDRLADCYRDCAAAGVPLVVEQIHTTAWSAEGTHEAVLTEIQRETLAAALDGGYFAVPRGATLQDLAREFDVSDTAISQRIRRGIARLLAAELGEAAPREAGVY